MAPCARNAAIVGGGGGPLVYLEGIRYGGCETLKNIEANTIAELRFLDSGEATTHFGSGHTSGIILVMLRRR